LPNHRLWTRAIQRNRSILGLDKTATTCDPSRKRLVRGRSPRMRCCPQYSYRGILPLSHWQIHTHLPLAQLKSSWYPVNRALIPISSIFLKPIIKHLIVKMFYHRLPLCLLSRTKSRSSRSAGADKSAGSCEVGSSSFAALGRSVQSQRSDIMRPLFSRTNIQGDRRRQKTRQTRPDSPH
jgi:hypothetical protein